MKFQRTLASALIVSLSISMVGCKLDEWLDEEVDGQTTTSPVPSTSVTTIPGEYKSVLAFEVLNNNDTTQYIATDVFYNPSDDTHLLTTDGVRFEGTVTTIEGRKIIVRPDTPSSLKFVISDGVVIGEDITLYGNYSLNNINQVRMADGSAVLSLTDSNVNYTGFGLKLPKLVVNELNNSKSKIENYANIYNNILIDSLKIEAGVSSINTLAERISQNAESKTMLKTESVKLNGNYNPHVIANRALNRINNDVPVDLLQAHTSSSTSKLFLEATYWTDSQGDVYAWFGYYPADNYNAVHLTYSDLESGAGLTSTQ